MASGLQSQVIRSCIGLGEPICVLFCADVQEEDVVVLEAPEDHPEWMLGAEVTDDGRCEAVKPPNLP